MVQMKEKVRLIGYIVKIKIFISHMVQMKVMLLKK